MIEVFVVQRSRLMAEVFSTVLREVEDIRVCGTATSANEAIHKMQSTKCDVALVNANLPDDGALRITQAFQVVSLHQSPYCGNQLAGTGPLEVY